MSAPPAHEAIWRLATREPALRKASTAERNFGVGGPFSPAETSWMLRALIEQQTAGRLVPRGSWDEELLRASTRSSAAAPLPPPPRRRQSGGPRRRGISLPVTLTSSSHSISPETLRWRSALASSRAIAPAGLSTSSSVGAAHRRSRARVIISPQLPSPPIEPEPWPPALLESPQYIAAAADDETTLSRNSDALIEKVTAQVAELERRVTAAETIARLKTTAERATSTTTTSTATAAATDTATTTTVTSSTDTMACVNVSTIHASEREGERSQMPVVSAMTNESDAPISSAAAMILLLDSKIAAMRSSLQKMTPPPLQQPVSSSSTATIGTSTVVSTEPEFARVSNAASSIISSVNTSIASTASLVPLSNASSMIGGGGRSGFVSQTVPPPLPHMLPLDPTPRIITPIPPIPTLTPSDFAGPELLKTSSISRSHRSSSSVTLEKPIEEGGEISSRGSSVEIHDRIHLPPLHRTPRTSTLPPPLPLAEISAAALTNTTITTSNPPPPYTTHDERILPLARALLSAARNERAREAATVLRISGFPSAARAAEGRTNATTTSGGVKNGSVGEGVGGVPLPPPPPFDLHLLAPRCRHGDMDAPGAPHPVSGFRQTGGGFTGVLSTDLRSLLSEATAANRANMSATALSARLAALNKPIDATAATATVDGSIDVKPPVPRFQHKAPISKGMAISSSLDHQHHHFKTPSSSLPSSSEPRFPSSNSINATSNSLSPQHLAAVLRAFGESLSIELPKRVIEAINVLPPTRGRSRAPSGGDDGDGDDDINCDNDRRGDGSGSGGGGVCALSAPRVRGKSAVRSVSSSDLGPLARSRSVSRAPSRQKRQEQSQPLVPAVAVLATTRGRTAEEIVANLPRRSLDETAASIARYAQRVASVEVRMKRAHDVVNALTRARGASQMGSVPTTLPHAPQPFFLRNTVLGTLLAEEREKFGV